MATLNQLIGRERERERQRTLAAHRMQPPKYPPQVIREENFRYQVFRYFHRLMSARPHQDPDFYTGAEA